MLKIPAAIAVRPISAYSLPARRCIGRSSRSIFRVGRAAGSPRRGAPPSLPGSARRRRPLIASVQEAFGIRANRPAFFRPWSSARASNASAARAGNAESSSRNQAVQMLRILSAGGGMKLGAGREPTRGGAGQNGHGAPLLVAFASACDAGCCRSFVLPEPEPPNSVAPGRQFFQET